MTIRRAIGELLRVHEIVARQEVDGELIRLLRPGRTRRGRTRRLPRPILRRPAAATGHRPGTGRAARRARRRRAGVGAGRVGAGDDPQPAHRAASRARPVGTLHRAQSRGGRSQAQRVAVMYLGRIVEIADVDEIFDQPSAPLHPGPDRIDPPHAPLPAARARGRPASHPARSTFRPAADSPPAAPQRRNAAGTTTPPFGRSTPRPRTRWRATSPRTCNHYPSSDPKKGRPRSK